MSQFRILQAENKGVIVLRFEGEVRLSVCCALDRLIEEIENRPHFVTVIVDLTQATMIDSTTLGLIAKLGLFARQERKVLPTIISNREDIDRLIHTMGLDDIFIVVREAATDLGDLQEVPQLTATETEVKEKVLCAHRILMELNEHNRNEFRDLVAMLESDVEGPSCPVNAQSARSKHLTH
ncbi:STAS domain-containing protein [Hahella sp. SMD15-11]|uniref:STAS domain-containing protein n=1 Tax=Thermohahella caldifontis TaxID=3142973 RepID=A0AB39UYF1_9GAMM